MPPGERRELRVFFQSGDVSSEGAAAVQAAIYFWHLTLKLTLGSASGPHGAAADSVDLLLGVMDTLQNAA